MGNQIIDKIKALSNLNQQDNESQSKIEK